MSPDLERDLERWERGELSRAALLAIHGDEAASLLDMYERLDSIGYEPVAYDETSWDALAAELPRHRAGKPIVRVIVLAAATVLLLASVAYGTIDPVRSTVDDLIGRRGTPSPTMTPRPTPTATSTPSPRETESPDDDKSDDSSGPGSSESDDSSGPGSGDDKDDDSSGPSSGSD